MAGEGETQSATTTCLDEESSAQKRTKPTPGAVLIFADRRPCESVFRALKAPLELGRFELTGGGGLDSMVSRSHVRLAFDGSEWQVEDLASRNGTFVNGQRIAGEARVKPGSLLRVGGAVLLVAADVTPFEHYGVGVQNGIVGGPTLRQALETIMRTQRMGMAPSLMISGETGTGKEIAAGVFHASGPNPSAPFSAVNCATIPKDIAERLLFGSRRGAFSGAADAQGYVQAAHGGTLFLDELAELPPEVQSKLLRMLETRQVLRLGATVPEPVEVRICAATWRNLREEVVAGRFREDLYFRIAQPEIRLPPLRERLEEIPWHIRQLLDDCGGELRVTATFVEACALRRWPGNVRELRAEVRRAAGAALAQSSELLSADDLSPSAGKPIASAQAHRHRTPFPDDEIAAALAAENGKVTPAARRLGVHRNKVRRWLERHQIDATAFKRGPKHE